jgi:hypothetical protein
MSQCCGQCWATKHTNGKVPACASDKNSERPMHAHCAPVAQYFRPHPVRHYESIGVDAQSRMRDYAIAIEIMKLSESIREIQNVLYDLEESVYSLGEIIKRRQ